MPNGPLGASVRRGLAILSATRDSLPEQVGNDLNCTSCHLDQGRRPYGLSWVGVYSQFPSYRARDGRVATIEDRINGCLLRSMNGHRLAADDDRMRDMVAYLAYLSVGIAPGDSVPGRGLKRPAGITGDTLAGREVWQRECARCHGADGGGTAAAPPTWGPRSFNIGAGMARFRTAAGFIRHNMPFDRPGTLSDHEAAAVAAWVISRDRPDFPGKENDWPAGDAPADAAYPTHAASRGL
jgi:thiosulfate dehydrogenase